MKNTKIYKNKSVSENNWIKWSTQKCTPWMNIWRYEDLETYKLLSKWVDSALNDPKRIDML